MNMTAANLEAAQPDSQRNPTWEILYEARKDYGLENLRPQQMNDLFNRMVSDSSLLQFYYRYVFNCNQSGNHYHYHYHYHFI